MVPRGAGVEAVLGYPQAALDKVEAHVRGLLASDTSAISTLRCLKLYLERLGTDFQDPEALSLVAGTTPPPPLSWSQTLVCFLVRKC